MEHERAEEQKDSASETETELESQEAGLLAAPTDDEDQARAKESEKPAEEVPQPSEIAEVVSLEAGAETSDGEALEEPLINALFIPEPSLDEKELEEEEVEAATETPAKKKTRGRAKKASIAALALKAATEFSPEDAIPVLDDESPLISEESLAAELGEDIEVAALDAAETDEVILHDEHEAGEGREHALDEIPIGTAELAEGLEDIELPMGLTETPPVASLKDEELLGAVESILFASERTVSLARFREVFGETGPNEEAILGALHTLRERYQHPSFGFEVRESQGGFHFVTKTQNAEWIRKFNQTKPFKVSRSALEVLAIIAYRQPVTRAEIDQVRGIDSSHLLRVLMERGLVKMDGKAEVPGRPVQYATTPKFLEVVGLANISALPPLTELEQLQGDTQDPMKTLEDGLDRIMSESRSSSEVAFGQENEGLQEIDTLIQSAEKGDREIYESQTHAEVAQENQLALDAFHEVTKLEKKNARAARKKSISYEDLTSGGMPMEAPTSPPEEPETVN